jgi:hypothetical protein
MNDFKSLLLDVLLIMIDIDDLNSQKYEKYLNKYILKYEENDKEGKISKNEIFEFLKHLFFEDEGEEEDDLVTENENITTFTDF